VPDPTPFLGPLPRTGPWTRLGMSRAWFLGILAISVVGFLLIDGPVWHHLHDSHLRRIVASYAIIPVGVLAAFARGWRGRLGQMVAATAVLALVKLVLTAAVLAVIQMAA
jgi:hypothetical protein